MNTGEPNRAVRTTVRTAGHFEELQVLEFVRGAAHVSPGDFPRAEAHALGSHPHFVCVMLGMIERAGGEFIESRGEPRAGNPMQRHDRGYCDGCGSDRNHGRWNQRGLTNRMKDFGFVVFFLML
jgi:hypothetical protein